MDTAGASERCEAMPIIQGRIIRALLHMGSLEYNENLRSFAELIGFQDDEEKKEVRCVCIYIREPVILFGVLEIPSLNGLMRTNATAGTPIDITVGAKIVCSGAAR